MAYPSYYDLSNMPVRQHPIPSYFEDPDEAPDYHMLVALWELGEEQRESRRRIAAAMSHRTDVHARLFPPCSGGLSQFQT